MRLRQLLELTRPNFRADAMELLRRSGWYQLGQGSFGTTYARSDRPFILKIFDPIDYAYLRYLKLILQETSPHFPVVRGKPIKVTEDYYAVQLEKLDPAEGSNIELTKYAQAYTRHFVDLYKEENEKYAVAKHLERVGIGDSPYDKAELIGSRRDAALAPLEQHYPTLAAALRSIAINVIIPSGAFPDMHPKNFMQRGTTLVIIDPVAYAKDYTPITFGDIGQKAPPPQQELGLGGDLGYRPDYASINNRGLPLPPLPRERQDIYVYHPQNRKLPFPNSG